MARFLMSPGVHIREIDQSQYASTAPAGQMAAIVGYAEKGPFDPVIVNGQQDFVETFGKTLADVPYLAQTANKYFAQGNSLLVVRAGDDRDPELYPSAAQYATKKIRVGASDMPATVGYQTFKADEDLPTGSFAPETTFSASVLADHRAFASSKYMETWSTMMEWTDLDGTPVSYTDQPQELANGVVKIAMPESDSKSFETDYKVFHAGTQKVGQYYGKGDRTGNSYGSEVSATVFLYQRTGDYTAATNNDYIQVNGSYQALVVGSNNMTTASWATDGTESFEVTLNQTQYTVDLNQDAADPDAIVDHINAQLASATDEEGESADISSKLEAFHFTPSPSDTRIGLRHTSAAEVGFEMGANPFGWNQGAHADSEAIFGTWMSEDETGATYRGNFVFEFDEKNESAISFQDEFEVSATSPASGSWALSDIEQQLQESVDDGYAEYPGDTPRMSVSLDTETGKIKIETSMTPPSIDNYAIVSIGAGSGNSLRSLLNGTDSSVTGEAAQPKGDSLVELFAAEKGEYGNKLVLRTVTEKIQRTPTDVEEIHNIFVLLDGKEVSTYQRVNWTNPLADNYVPKVLESNPYLHMDAEDEDGDSTLSLLPDGDWQLGTTDLPEGVYSSSSIGGNGIRADILEAKVGTNGYTKESEAITSMSADFVNALQKIYNPEVYDFNLVVAPGDASSIVQNAVVQLTESRRDCFGVLDAAPFGMGLGVKNKLNTVSEVNEAVSNLNSSYVGAYWPWLQDYDSDNKQYIWLPPSSYALAQMVYTDNVSDPWFATAGLRRGKVTAIDVEYSPTRMDRDLLYGETNIVNPIVKLVGEGIAIWGQKTAQRTQSATDRINVRRLLIYAEKLIANMARGFLFEPNDPANWAAFARQANAILEPIRQRRGLYQYSVVCDESTNPPELVNQNIMAGKIFLQPTKAIEFVEVSFTITAYGTEISEG